MGSIYRSELMTRCQIFLQTDSAYCCIAELGELGLAQFIDLNEDVNSFQKKYINEVRRCEEMERKLRFVEEEVENDGIAIVDSEEHVPAPLPKDMNELEANFEKLEEQLLGINTNLKALKDSYIKQVERRAVLEKVKLLLGEGNRSAAAQSISEAVRGEAGPIITVQANGVNGYANGPSKGGDLASVLEDKKDRENTELRFIAGVIKRDRVPTFERLLWRLARGKVYVRALDMDEDEDSDLSDGVEKAVFILFFSGEQLRSKVKKACDGFRAHIYECPDNAVERAMQATSLQVEIGDMLSVINKTLDYRHRIVAAAASSIRNWKIKVLKLKAVFETLNKFNMDVTQKCLIAECWVPTVDLLVIQQSLRTGTERAGSLVQPVLNQMETFETPPTYFKLNKFTRGFQNIVDAYGIANYREVNPAPWTIITFPFLFAVMFGDAGHGIIMFLSALMFVLFEKKLEAAKIKDEIFNTFYGGRYVILLMGLFSIYTGIVYNDFYSKAVDIFGSKWRNPYNHTLLDQLEEYGRINDQEVELEMNPRYAFLHGGGPYPFGVDPVWNLAKNKLNFLNPMKMKLSVVIGIGQMAFGIILSLCNYIHKGSWVDFLFIFIPQVLFLSCIFIYLCVQIFLKWIFFWVIDNKKILGNIYPGSNCAPSLLIGLINMFMMKSLNDGFLEPDPTPEDPNHMKTVDQCYQVQWYPHQSMIEKALLAVAVVSIPVMLLVKPFILRWKHNHGYHVDTGHGDEGHGEFSFADVMVYQAIHTIEFALGCISHTASYLRLWALSLAHAQLSEVLWDMVLAIALQMGGWAGAAAIHIIFWAFAVLSVSILVLMEGLSAFLHAIRLHWVEFQSKFYGGTGIQFEPFNFNQLIRIMEGFQE